MSAGASSSGVTGLNDPRKRYHGPDFTEYCIREGEYLSARRDRVACVRCPLSELCLAGFDEQVRRVRVGEDPSLTHGVAAAIDTRALLKDLRTDQRAFVLTHVPGIGRSRNGEAQRRRHPTRSKA
jgi:hypothetical protein